MSSQTQTAICIVFKCQIGTDVISSGFAAAAIVISIKTLPLINVDNTDLQEHHKSTGKHHAAPAFSVSPW
jgi:hypothetical protein